MCESDIKKSNEEQTLILMRSAHESERSRILNIILQKRDKLDIGDEVELRIYNELTDIVNKIQK